MKTTLRNLNMAAVAIFVVGFAFSAVANDCSSRPASYSDKQAAEETLAIFPLAEKAGFSTLVAAIKAVGLEETLTEGGPFTVFAPTDEAFAKLPEGTVEGLLEDKEALKSILLYHVAAGTVLANDVVKLDVAETLNGQKLSINAKHEVRINDAKVIKTDVMAKNGVIHVIDTVLLPQNM